MNKSVILAFVAMALVLCVVALFLAGPRKPVAPVVDSTAAAAPNPDVVPPKAQSRPAVANDAAPTPGAMSSSQSGSASLAAVRPPATPAPPAPEPDDADNPSDELFLSDDEIAAAIRKEGGAGPVYSAASASHRRDIIDYLMAEEQLRENLPALLPLEDDSVLRAYMLERTIPKGYFDAAAAVPMGTDSPVATGEAGDSPDAAKAAAGNPSIDDGPEAAASVTVDTELQALLDQTPSTPMEADEWLARLDLALMTDEAFGLAWARKARDEGPGDASVQALAASILLNLAQGDPAIGDDEQHRAQQTLTDSLATAVSAGSIDPNQRIRAYYALYFAPLRVEARDFLTKQRALETDPHARQTLNQLLERWDKGGANPGSPGGHGG